MLPVEPAAIGEMAVEDDCVVLPDENRWWRLSFRSQDRDDPPTVR
jgi:hypothetical protein